MKNRHFHYLSLVAVISCLLWAGFSLRAQVKKSQDDRVVRFNTSLAYEAEEKYVEALSALEAVAGGGKDDYLVSLRLGWLRYLNNQYSKSAADYRRAGELSGGRSVEALLGLTLPLAAQDQWGEVEATYKKILAIDPSHYTANLRLGQLYLNQGKADLADRHLAKVLALYPSDYEANLYSAWNCISLGQSGRARSLFELVLMVSPGDTSATRGLESVR